MKKKLQEKQESQFFALSSRRNSTSHSILEVSFTQENERIIEENKYTRNILDDLKENPIEKDMLLDSFENFEIE